jgi:hypothetical protein
VIFLLCRTYLELICREFALLRHDFASMHESVRSCEVSGGERCSATQADILRAIDLAAVFYFKEVKCLQRSVVTARLLRRHGFPAEMVIGVQQVPFYAHAWVELEGTVLSDKPYVSQMYAVIERC